MYVTLVMMQNPTLIVSIHRSDALVIIIRSSSSISSKKSATTHNKGCVSDDELIRDWEQSADRQWWQVREACSVLRCFISRHHHSTQHA